MDTFSIQSYCKVYFGSRWADHSAQRENGLSHLAFQTLDTMSDELNALNNDPMTLVEDPSANPVVVPWASEGMVIMNLMGGLVSASILHRDMSLKDRCET